VGARSKARKRALDVLFEADQRGLNVMEALEIRMAEPGVETALPEYAAQIVRGVAQHWHEIDSAMAAHSEGWVVSRMPAVDRAALRIAVWEILFNDEVAPAIAIDQAVDLVTDLSTEESPGFVNGLLGAIAAAAPGAIAGAEPGASDSTPEGGAVDPLH
jgi:N utilization substance protein B